MESKPQKRSLAIAYAMRRRAKKMAAGGQVKGVAEGGLIDRIMRKRARHRRR